MYVRFVVAECDEDTHAEAGLFQSAVGIKYEDLPAPEWIRAAVTREVEWFNECLDKPARVWR